MGQSPWNGERAIVRDTSIGTEVPVDSDSYTRRYPVNSSLLVLAALGALRIILGAIMPADGVIFIAPTLACLFVFAVFSLLLQHQIQESIFGELGFLYIGMIVAYTILPAFAFMSASFYQGLPLDQLLPEPAELRTHLWRQVMFETGVATGYLLLRGRATWRPPEIWDRPDRDRRTVIVVATLIIVSLTMMTVLSGPVETYWDNYTRYNHLPVLLHKFVSLCIRMSLGLYCVLLVFLFRNYEKYKLIIPVVVVAICAHEVIYSLGARIQALIVLLEAVTLYHFTVKKISLKVGLLTFAALAAVFSAIELVRALQGDIASARSTVAEEGFKPATEFISVFFPSFHLYAERAAGTLPPREWAMFFNDFISLFTFGDFLRWEPMAWYARNYYPSAEVSPFTMGPIADSAIWGGEIDLVLRALINGAFFAYIARWFTRHGDTWWGLAIYVYCCATCILTIKYTVFHDLGLIEKNLLPVLLMVYFTRRLSFSDRREGLPT